MLAYFLLPVRIFRNKIHKIIPNIKYKKMKIVFNIISVIIICLFFIIAGCSEKKKKNRVNLDQINVDNSNNYRHIFKDHIKSSKEKNYYREKPGKNNW